MYWGNELKLIYATIILMLEINVNTGAMEKMSSIMTENMDDLKSLEVCMARNQQRLGSVYGNFTRHHKKGHRRRTTTTIPTTVVSTTELEETTTYGTTDPVSETTNAKLPKPLRLSASSLEDDYNEDNHNLDKELDEEIIDIIAKERHAKHHNRNKELIQDISETRSSHLNKVKKMYRDSTASAVNRLNAKSSKNGIFLTENCTTVLAQIGTMAVLHCEVSDITENTVTWIRRKDYSLLSVGLVTYSADNRFYSAHGRHVKDWALHIRFATSADAGYYECQVPTHPPTSIFFKLVLVAAYAEIMGESEKIIHEGSMLRLVCVVRRSTEPPSYVFWYFENRMINYDLNGVSVHNGRQTSELVIGKAQPRHAGNYTCVPANAKAASVTVHVVQSKPSVVIDKASVVIDMAQPRYAGNYTCVPANAKAASVTVHVVQSETPAAMQHGNNSSSSRNRVHFLIILLLVSLMSRLSINGHCKELG